MGSKPWDDTVESLRAQLAESQAEAARMREALDFYAKRKHINPTPQSGVVYDLFPDGPVTVESGTRARAAIAPTPEPRP